MQLARLSAMIRRCPGVRRCLYLVVAPLLFSVGCATDYEKAQWAEVRKDLRGDNMKMGSAGHSGPMTADLP